ncbi:C40 family peptidase [Williamsia herbipolensis]|uniref:C40 family peptidase n=1 Tax=Williamsia herbipolensis TaxID=1603258 RepID=UPI0005F782B4|nr:C40 family peptidase [Williamsia herbipolensis]
MSSPIDLLATPIRTLLASVGTGEMPGADPAAELRDCCCRLEGSSRDLEGATQKALSQWRSRAADSAEQTIGAHRRHGRQLADDSADLADLLDEGRAEVAAAARELRTVLDSFVSAADALGPSVYTPNGVAALIPIAAEHLRRALAVVRRTHDRLGALARRAQRLGRQAAPASMPDLATLMKQVSTSAGPSSSRPGRQTDRPATSSGASTHAASAGDPHATAPAGRPPTPGAVPVTLPDGSVAWAPNQRAATAVRAALSQRGVPYAWGGTTPGRGLDCSALTQYAYRQAGVELPRLAQDQDTAGFRVDRSELLPGDLAVWSGHVAMIVGNGQMIEAGDPVGLSPIRTTNLDQTFEGFYRPR